MDYAAWEPIYERIVEDFGFDQAADRRARDLLAAAVSPFPRSRLDFEAQQVAIAGGSTKLEAELDAVRQADRVVAISGAAAVLEEAAVRPDLVVTDLDKTPETAIDLSKRGVPVAVHAHGDNIPLIETYLPQFDPEQVLATTQVEPTETVANFGGFTDGDRGAFIASAFGAGGLSFPGWDLSDETVDADKARKLLWAARLLRCLERRRGERFPPLDGRRSDLDRFPPDRPFRCEPDE
ncbi:MAG: 6-hydroxymethylpterin diphosphokinase MptE-like protein [Halodesulfurarchaeum sp.]